MWGIGVPGRSQANETASLVAPQGVAGPCGAVVTDPAYAAAAAAILAGMLGLIPLREVFAAVLAAAISVLLRVRPDQGTG